MRKLLYVVLAVVVLGALAVALVLRKLDPEALGQAVVARVNASGNMQLEAERFDISVTRGLRIEQATLSGRSDGGEIDASLGGVLLEHELLPLLSGRVVVHRLVLDEPRVDLLTRPAAETDTEPAASGQRGTQGAEQQAEPQPEGAGGEGAADETDAADRGDRELTLDVKQITVKNGALSVTQRGQPQPSLALQGLELQIDDVLMQPPAEGRPGSMRLGGRFEAAALRFDTLDLREAGGQLSFEDGRLEVPKLGARLDHARLELDELVAELGQDPFSYRTGLGGEVDLNGMLQAREQGFAPLVLDAAANGAGPQLDALEARGKLELAEGSIPPAPIFDELELLLGKGFFSGTRYQATEIAFVLRGGVLGLEPFELKAENLVVAGSGSADLAGPLALKLAVSAPTDRFKSDQISEQDMQALSDDRGWVTLPLVVEGTLEQPDVALDMQAIGELLSQALKQGVKKGVSKQIDKLFKRR